jgi:hypothetical protein
MRPIKKPIEKLGPLGAKKLGRNFKRERKLSRPSGPEGSACRRGIVHGDLEQSYSLLELDSQQAASGPRAKRALKPPLFVILEMKQTTETNDVISKEFGFL